MTHGANQTGTRAPLLDLAPLDVPPTGLPPSLSIALVDAAGRIRHWSPGCEALYGWTASEAIALEMSPIGTVTYDVPTQRLEWSHQRWRPSGVEGGSFSVEQLVTGPAGSMFDRIIDECRAALAEDHDQIDFKFPARGESLGDRMVRIRARLVRNEDGVVKRFVGLMQDMTDAGFRTRALRNREAAISTILKTVSDAMIVVDRDGIISAFSRAAQELLGHDSLSMIGKSIDVLLEGGWSDMVVAADYGGTRELWATDATGRRLPVEVRVGSLPIDIVSAYILFLTDISERRAKEARQTKFEHTAHDIAMAEAT